MSEQISELIGKVLPIETGPQEARICAKCGQSLLNFFRSVQFEDCPSCLDEWNQREAWPFERQRLLAESEAVRLAEWKRICPDEFFEFDEKKISRQFNRKASDAAFQWEYQPKGVLLIGATGRGKSCTAWRVGRREYLAGHSVAVLDSQAGLSYAKLFNRSAKDAADWIQRKIDADILIADDLFKAKVSDSLGMSIFTVFDQRTSCGRPIICTLNESPASLRERFGEDRGPAIFRRLHEYCECIAF